MRCIWKTRKRSTVKDQNVRCVDRNEKGDIVKNMHFCTKELLKEIYDGQPGDIIETYRTGFVPSVYPKDIINLNDRTPGAKDKFICQGKIKYVFPLQHREFIMQGKKISSRHKKGIKEIKRYNRKFYYDHWFFCIGIELYPEVKS